MTSEAIQTMPEAGPTRSRLARRWLGSPLATAILQGILSAILLLVVCNRHEIYEEDQMAKTAQIMALAHDSNWLHYSRVTDYYRADLFSSYYLAATGFYELSGLPPVEALTVMSVVCGVIFLAVIPFFLRRVFELPQWLSWLVLVNAPILVISSVYGNEGSFALAMTAVAALALSFNTATGRILGAIGYVLAAYARSDYLLLWPALALLTLVRNENGVDWRRSFRNGGQFAVLSAVFGIAYLALILRKWPAPEGVEFNPKLAVIIALILYSPNPVNVLLAMAGAAVCRAPGRRKFFLLLPVLVQTGPYYQNLVSGKYLLPSFVVLLIFATVGLQWLMRRFPPAILVLAVPWVVAITPFGVFGPSRAPYWYVPTVDGPAPAGGYATFYAKAKQGFYQRRYDQDLKQVSELMPLMDREPGAHFFGYVNFQTFCLWATTHGRWEKLTDLLAFWASESRCADHPTFMIKSGFLYAQKILTTDNGDFDAFCRDGRVRAAVGDGADPFPDVLECGLLVPAGADANLGKRIHFVNDYFRGNHVIRGDSFLAEFAGVSWIPGARYDREKSGLPKPIYLDSQWACFSQPVSGAVYYSLRYPRAYANFR